MAGERIAQRLHQRVAAETFDGADLGAVARNCPGDAASCGRPVDQHRARAAYAVFAAEMGAGQAERVAEEVGEMRARLDRRLDRVAVDGQG